MTDLISRADAIEVVAGAIWHYPNQCYKDLNVYEFAEALAKDALSAIPSAEAVSRDAIISAKFHPLPDTHITPADVEAESYKRGWNDALDAVADNALSAEAVQGDWEKTVGGNGWNHWWVFKCPFCGATIEDKQCRSWEYNFCPNCGARMKGGADE